MQNEIKATLVRLVERPREGSGDQLLTDIRALDSLLSENRSRLDARLVHFLERRSYAKALEYMHGKGT